MHAGGLGDIRIVTDLWLLDPHTHMEGNIALGIGLKAPTGDDKASDISYRKTGPVARPVDPSIQPGDGGWGMILELQAYQKLFGNLFAFVQGSYLITPEEQNETETPLGDRSTIPSVVKHDSIPDQYFGRGGFSYVLWPKRRTIVSLWHRASRVSLFTMRLAAAWAFGVQATRFPSSPAFHGPERRTHFPSTLLLLCIESASGAPQKSPWAHLAADAAFADFSILASFTHRF